MTTENAAFDSIIAHHVALTEQLNDGIEQLAEEVSAGRDAAATLDALCRFLDGDVLAHALAEEHSLYRAGADLPDFGSVMVSMFDEHRVLEAAVTSLKEPASGAESLERARRVGWLFQEHVTKENDVLLPALLKADDVNLAELHDEMSRLFEAAQDDATSDHQHETDVVASLLAILLSSAKSLARAGEGDRACRDVAAAWVVLRSNRADLAARVTAQLHGLVKLLAKEPVTLRPKPIAGFDDRIVDVRHLAPAQRHEVIFSEFHALQPAAAYQLVNDHDPKPLRYQFEAEYAELFTWDYLETGPTVWRVRIGRVGAPSAALA